METDKLTFVYKTRLQLYTNSKSAEKKIIRSALIYTE